MSKFGPRNKKEEEIYSVESFRINLQHVIYKKMQEKGMTIKDLAKKLNMAEYETNLIFDSDCNLDLRTLGKILHILGLQMRLVKND